MRPDPYKQKKSRRYQLTHKNKIESKTDKDTNSNSNNNTPDPTNTNTNANTNSRPKRFNRRANKTFIDEETGKSYARRKIYDNSFRYEEPTYEDQLEAEADIDVEVEDALSLINSQEVTTTYDPSSYFHFKKENYLDNDEFNKNDEKMQEIFNIDFNQLDRSFKKIPIWDRIKTNKDFIIDNENTGYVDESKTVNKIMPSYNYLHSEGVSLTNKFQFSIPVSQETTPSSPTTSNDRQETSKTSHLVPETTPQNKNTETAIPSSDPTVHTKTNNRKSSTEPSSHGQKDHSLDFDLDELLTAETVPKPVNAKKDHELEDELDRLLSLESEKSKPNTSKNSKNVNDQDLALDELISTTTTPPTNNTNTTNKQKNNSNIENLDDWLDDLLS